MTHILGGSNNNHDDHGHDESRKVYVTNFFSFGHLIPWGGLVDVKRLTLEEVKHMFKDKRIDLFAYPDLEIMRDLVNNRIIMTGEAPQGTPEEHDAAFCQGVEALVAQATDCHIRTVNKPKPQDLGC